jgi:type IV pilus assembly protein PilE
MAMEVPTARRAARAFTLIELLIALAVLGLLAAIALPAYFDSVARARRTDLQAALLEDAGYLQHYYAAHGAFSGKPPPALPATTSPRDGDANYRIEVAVPPTDPSSFVLTATRSGAMQQDPCGDFTYDHLGQRGLVSGTPTNGRTTASCWR